MEVFLRFIALADSDPGVQLTRLLGRFTGLRCG